MARKRHEHEESKVAECQQNIKRIEASQGRQSLIVEADENSERDESSDSRKGMEMLAQVNGDLEQLIRSVYAKLKTEQESKNCTHIVMAAP